MVTVLLAIFAASTLILCYLIFIWWLDRYEREPFWLVGMTFLWGALGGTIASCYVNSTIGSIVATSLTKAQAEMFVAVLVAPPVEEFMKGLVFVPLLFLGSNVDNRTDGLIYGAATGLGFSFLENLWYYVNNVGLGADSLLQVIFIRTLFTSLVHCISSALLGMALGYARHRAGTLRWLLWPLVGYFFAVLNHATWNAIASFTGLAAKTDKAELAGVAFLLGMFVVVCAAAMMFIMTQISLHAEHKAIRKHLLEESRRGVIPASHADIIPFWMRRSKSGWLPGHVNKEAYIRDATLLAFRHHQLELAQGERREEYLEDIARYRAAVAEHLRPRIA